MRAACSICSDLYDGDEENPIAAIVVCGHTFHDSCLTQWLSRSSTCPQCRKKVTAKNIVHKLFFDLVEDGKDAQSPSRLQNEIGTLKASLRTKDREINEVEEAKLSLNEELKKMTKLKAKVEKSLKTELTATASLNKELSWYRDQQKIALQAQQEAGRLKEQLDALSSVQTVIQGLEDDVQEMIAHQGDVKQLAKWCAVLKKELSTKRRESKQLKEQVERLNKTSAMRNRDLKEKTEQLQNVKEQLKNTEEDMKAADREIQSLKKKMGALKSAIESPGNSTASSFARRLMMESPAPMPSAKKPRLSDPFCDDEKVDLNVTPDLFSPAPSEKRDCPKFEPSPRTQTKQDCQEFGTNFIKFSKAGAGQKKNRDVTDISNQLPVGMNIFKKPGAGSSGIMRKGYNGLGGHSSFLQPKGQLRSNDLMKKVKKVSTKIRNLGPAPALPTLNLSDS